MLNYKDVIKFKWNKKHVLEVPLYYLTKEDSQITTFLLTGTLADCPGLEITHFIFAARNFVEINKGHYNQTANNRKGRERCPANIRYSSTYSIKNPKTGDIETVDFTFVNPNHMSTLYQYFAPAIKKYLIDVKHYRRIEYAGEWFETTIIPTAIGYPAQGIGVPENAPKSGNKTKVLEQNVDND